MSRSPNNGPSSEYGASIGTVLREWRKSRAKSRAWLAKNMEIPVSRLAQIERGELCPEESTIDALAASLDKTVPEFWARAGETFQQRIRLQGLLEDLGIPRDSWEEFLALEADARDDFIRAMEGRLPSNSHRRIKIQTIEEAIERDGLEPSIPLLLAGIAEHGLLPTDHFRASVELEEMPGNRSVFTDRLPISPVAVPMDQLYLFRASYGMDPPNPMLLKWWAESRRSAMNDTLKHYVSRTIVPIGRLERYIRTGERAPNLLLPPDIVLLHLVAMIELLRTKPEFQVGLTESEIPMTYRVKGNHHVLVTVYGQGRLRLEPRTRTTLLLSQPSVVRRFGEHFDRVWNDIDHDRKDGTLVADWLENQLSEVGKGRCC